MDYKNAGVDIEAGYKSVELMKKHVQATMRPEVLTNIGGFSGAFSMEKFKDMEKPTLVSGTDGVGTKLKLAFIMDKHDTIGIDCVAMCVNDIICCGAKPIAFLDYIAIGKNEPEKVANADMRPFTAMWLKILSIFENQDTTFLTKILVFVLGSLAVAILLTVLYFFCAKAILGIKKPKETEETLENARNLQERFENIQPYKADVLAEVRIHFLSFFLNFLVLGITQLQVEGVEKAFPLGFLYAVLTTIIFAILRAIFILFVKVCWKENSALKTELETELKNTVNYLSKKEKEASERHKAEEFAKEKKENLERAEAMYEAYIEEGSDDIHRLYEIAMLGHHDANLAYMEWCLPKTVSPEMTRVEQKKYLQSIYDALVVVGKYDQHSSITKFFYYSSMMGLGKIKDAKAAQKVLEELRCIKESGDLSEEHTEVCKDLIETLVRFINKY